MLHAETERLSRIVNDLVTANSLADDDTRQPPGECDLEALVERARERCPDNLQLRKRLPEGTEPAAADEERLEQILDSLLDNAIRYSPNGGEIELAVERSDNLIRFSVRDPGIGIDTRHHPHIGEKFYRADPEQQTGAAGLGLGLYICNQVAALINGRAPLVRVQRRCRIHLLPRARRVRGGLPTTGSPTKPSATTSSRGLP